MRDDRVLRGTRWLAIFIIPFLVVASIMLFFWPQDTGRLFAWPIKPSMTAMMLAAAYMGGIYFFTAVVLASHWHTIKTGFLPVLAFASLLGIATLLHWDRFTHGHVSFYAWAGLYFIAPFLVLGVWLLNRRTDPNLLADGDVEIPRVIRWLVGVVGVITVFIAFLLFVQPGLMLAAWPWTLTPLTARRCRRHVCPARHCRSEHCSRPPLERGAYHPAGAGLFHPRDIDRRCQGLGRF